MIVATGRVRAPFARAAYVTPTNQFPLGIPMSMARRVELLDWAQSTDAWIIEDDYDGEFRYDGSPHLPLAALEKIVLQLEF
jgi:GntR family transcriptional regulator / MocR family aminotransferase